MKTLSIDIETFSSVDLKKAGLYKYVQSPDFEMLLFAWEFDDEPVQIVDLKNGEYIPTNLRDAMFDPSIIKKAYNATFEWYCLSKHFNLLENCRDWWISQWRCTQLHGLYTGFPVGLGAISEAIGLPQDKKKLGTGGALIRTFCVPCKPSKANGMRTRTLPHHEPAKWELFKHYCMMDVEAEHSVANKLQNFPVPESEQHLWELDVLMNASGVGLDMDLVNSALYLSEKTAEELTQEAIELTGLDNPNSVKQLTKWLSDELDEDITTLRKEDVSEKLKIVDEGKTKRLLELRQEMSKTSVRKYTAMEKCVGADGRGRGFLQHYGANRTGRYAGRIVQIQNLPRNHLETLDHARECVKARKLDVVKIVYGSMPDTLSQLIRTAFIPADGKAFAIADYSAIEARVIAWLAGEQWRQDVFATHGKIYEASASQMFGVPLEKIKKGNPEYELRQRGKTAELALGYQGGVNALTKMDTFNLLTEEEKPDIVKRWRAASPNIVQFWSHLNNAAIDVVKFGGHANVGYCTLYTTYDRENNLAFLVIRLPNGRELFYPNPTLTLNRWGRDEVQYWGVDQDTKKWGLIKTYGGKLCENITQAVARDCLCEAIIELTRRGYHIVFHVHDEVVIEIDKEKAEETLQEALAVMATPIPWAEGLLLGGAGFVTNYYMKD